MGRKPPPEPVCDLCFPKQCTQEEPERTCTVNEILIGSALGLAIGGLAGYASPDAGIISAIAAGGSVLLLKIASFADIKTKFEPLQNIIEFERDYTCATSGFLGGIIGGGVGSKFVFGENAE